MWVVRELLRLLMRIGVAVLLAIVIAEIRALIGGGDTLHTFRWVLIAFGAVFLLLAGTGTGSAASHRLNWGEITPGRGGVIFRAVQPRPSDPRLAPTAVFVTSGLILLVLGAVL